MVDNANIGKECDMRGGCRWPLQVVARGIVQDVDPLTDFGNRKLEEGNFKVYVNVVHDSNVQLPCPHDEYFTTLGHIGQGSVIWPRELLVFNSNASTCS
ncbi:hypothetical protein FRX31_003569 [Thalictrum thalictroides]|uniref:DUF8039 domain-containing protein n=2 Tax=Thalictrum thalictroides TaxID=46969 RepID=A0A7J6XAQ5_THATH|nr:hypothetical protein FRX31_003569 [Thalictrum thalictroides]